MKKILLFIPLVVSTIILFIVKLILNNNGLTFMSSIYYWFISINFVYLIIYSLYLFKGDKKLRKIIMKTEIIIFVFVFSAMKLWYLGNDVRINKNYVQNKFAIEARPPRIAYKYVNQFVRGNEEIWCDGEICVISNEY